MKQLRIAREHRLFAPHMLSGPEPIPPAGHFEWVREALQEACATTDIPFPIKFFKVHWLEQPKIESRQREIGVRLIPTAGGFDYQIRGVNRGDDDVHSSGAVSFGSTTNASTPRRLATHDSAPRIEHKPAGNGQIANFDVVGSFQSSAHSATAKIAIPSNSGYPLDPAVLDGAFQCVLLHINQYRDGNRAYVPLSLAELVFYAPVLSNCSIRLQNTNTAHFRYDLYLTDETGYLIAEMRGLCVKSATDEVNPRLPPTALGLHPLS